MDKALRSPDPRESLREMVETLNACGVSKDELVWQFNVFLGEIAENADRENDVIILEDVLDMMTGWYVGQNLDLK